MPTSKLCVCAHMCLCKRAKKVRFYKKNRLTDRQWAVKLSIKRKSNKQTKQVWCLLKKIVTLALWNSNWAFLALGYSKKFIRLTAGTTRLIRAWQRGSDGDQTQTPPLPTQPPPPTPTQLPKSNQQKDPPWWHTITVVTAYTAPARSPAPKSILSKIQSTAF